MPSDEEGLLVITADGRVIQFETPATKPRRNQIMRLWISGDLDDHVRFRGTPSGEGWLRRIEMRETDWTMIAAKDGSEIGFPCRPAPPKSLPQWFGELLDQNLTLLHDQQSQQETKR